MTYCITVKCFTVYITLMYHLLIYTSFEGIGTVRWVLALLLKLCLGGKTVSSGFTLIVFI